MTQDKNTKLNILLTNDDGPLDEFVSQYVRPFVQYIVQHKKNWNLVICVPDSQKSWIGKAHFAGKNLQCTFLYSNSKSPNNKDYIGPFTKPLLYNTTTKFKPSTNSITFPYTHPVTHQTFKTYSDLKNYYDVEWCCVNGTPASCCDIGLHHITTISKFDLVISGPNVGRNCSRPYITSSGTVGAAFESCITGRTKAIALSWAYFDGKKNFDELIYQKASKISCEIIESLYEKWGVGGNQDEVELYSVNVPIHQDLNEHDIKAIFTPLLDNKWCSIYDTVESEEAVVFEWNPDFQHNRDQMLESLKNGEINDGAVIEDKQVSITPLFASFKQAIDTSSIGTTLDYQTPSFETVSGNSSFNDSTQAMLCMSIDNKEYIYQPIINAVKKYAPHVSIVTELPPDFTETCESDNNQNLKVVQYADYEDIDHEFLNSLASQRVFATNTYTYRKSLIRKHYLNNTIKMFCSKNPESILNSAFLDSYHLELDYAEFLDDSLDDNWELRQDLEEENEDKWWIVKPSMSDKGQGIRVFKTIDDLQAIFDLFDEGVETDDEYEDEDEEVDGTALSVTTAKDDNKIIISQLRHFIIQRYLTNPLLLPQMNNKKFHIRCYVLCNGDLDVHVYDRMLALFAPDKYEKPSADQELNESTKNLQCHLTNTCLQENKENSVREFDTLIDLTMEQKETVKTQIHEIVKDLFMAATNDKMNFQAIANAFEIFGLDFLVDDQYKVKLLECNSYPDFKQTGDDLKDLIDELFDGVAKQAICSRLAFSEASFASLTEKAPENFTQVLSNTGKSW
ncbi:hypothetical protein ACO0QE_003306 [Hanseniaspora vineae]